MSEFFGEIFNWINNTITGNYGLSIILFTILFRLLLLPFDIRSRVGQREYTKKLNKIKPEMDMINKAYKNDPQKAQQMMMAIRKREGIGMLPKGCGTMLLTYPILIAFFAVFRNIAAEKTMELAGYADYLNEASELYNPEAYQPAVAEWFDTNGFLWIKNIWQPDVFFNFSETWGMRTIWIINGIDGNVLPETVQQVQAVLSPVDLAGQSQTVFDNLANARTYIAEAYPTISSVAQFGGNGFYIFPLLSGLAQVLSFKMTSAQQQADPMAQQQGKGGGKFMKIFFPILFVYFCLVSSAALAIYWTTSSLCMIVSNYTINKVLDARDKKKLQLEGEK